MPQRTPAASAASTNGEMPPPCATYRVQLRSDGDLDHARSLLPWLQQLGISHLYLSPVLAARAGSSHGYDMIDPTLVDPVLGGEAAFAALCEAAKAAGIGVVVDIVPNHMAFSPQNPFLAEVLRDGPDSRYASWFDIDWAAGRLHFPVLDAPIAELLGCGQVAIAGDEARPALQVYEEIYPLSPTPLAAALARGERTLDAATLGDLLQQQHWSLGDWRTSSGKVIHRRFFNVTELVGVRQEDPAVFEATHRWLIDQVAAGRIQGVRVDHVDGLARPGGYLHRLRSALGGVPIWIEKIVKAEEILAPWPVEGMSGYEFMAPLTRFLTCAEGLGALRDAAQGAVPDAIAPAVRAVRKSLLSGMFAPEWARVLEAAHRALAADAQGAAAQRDIAALDKALSDLACAWPVYRSYAADGCPPAAGPQAVLEADASHGARLAADLLHAPDDALSRSFAARFEQLTGALTAKSEEDTMFYRAVAYLPLCEVGAEPELAAIDAAEFAALMQRRAAHYPLALSALSTHDTKRSVDARGALIALSWRPALGTRLYRAARQQALATGLPEAWGLYALQSALAMRGGEDAQSRLIAHMAKALREGKELSSHEAPDMQAEEAAGQLAASLYAGLESGSLWSTDEAADFDAVRETIVLAQVAFQITAPGIPDIYRSSEGLHIALTDPDNRRPVDWTGLAALIGDESTLSGRKLALTRELLARRSRDPALFARGEYALESGPTGWQVIRRHDGREERITIPAPLRAAGPATAPDP